MGKRTTIFKQLILNIVIPAILALLALGVINVKQTLDILKDTSENTSKIISQEIRQMHEMQDMAMRLLEEQIDPVLKENSLKLRNEVFADTDGIEYANLERIRDSLGMDADNEDIYVINRRGIVVNTTFKADLGLSLFEFGAEHREMLESVWEADDFLSEKFTVENSTRRLKKFTYIPTLDGEFLIELGIYSDRADSIINFVKSRMNNMSSAKSNIISVHLFIGKEAPISLNGDGKIDDHHLDIYREVMEDQQRKTINDRSVKPPVRTDFIFMDRKNTSLYKESVIRIVSDISQEIIVLRRELFKFLLIFVFTMVLVVILLYKKTRVITDPIKKLVDNVNRISAGHLNERADVVGNNEITSLSERFNEMIAQLESYYNELEEKVKERTAEVVAQKEEIEAQRDTLEEQRNMLSEINKSLEKAYHEIEDSIHYASRIQKAILPPDDYLQRVIPDAFFYYKPRDIVSGDFYWVASKEGKLLVSAVDCTGHGVPGAFMSIVGFNHLNYALNVREETEPGKILSILDEGVKSTLRQTKQESVHDGMDLAMICLDRKKGMLEFAGSFNPLVIVSGGVAEKIKGDRIPIGGHILQSEKKKFKNHRIRYKKGDMIYMFSDGYADQFGGEKGGKYMSGKFVKLLERISGNDLEKQYQLLDEELKRWMGEEIQIDDILVIGMRL